MTPKLYFDCPLKSFNERKKSMNIVPFNNENKNCPTVKRSNIQNSIAGNNANLSDDFIIVPPIVINRWLTTYNINYS